MSATEKLRRLLDERGVEYEGSKRSLRWRDRYGIMMQAFPLANGELGMDVWSCTPEQAIAATLGRETCELINAADDLGKGTSSCMCFECGYTAPDDWWDEFKFCPNCGARIEVDS